MNLNFKYSMSAGGHLSLVWCCVDHFCVLCLESISSICLVC